ncbi:MAG: hypothetical protein QNK23_12575 [Crocinitomicaceae bacterium]|nr:hypothetical protein [Crocinitomicaceae bacterium]
MDFIKNDPYYRERNGDLVTSNNYVDFGIRLSYLRKLTQKFAVGFEYGVDFSNVSLSNSIKWRKSEAVSINTHSLMPKIFWTSGIAKLSVTISGQFGIAITSTYVQKKE